MIRSNSLDGSQMVLVFEVCVTGFSVGAVSWLLFVTQRTEQIVNADCSLNARVRNMSARVNSTGNPRVFTCAHRYLLNIYTTQCWDHRNISACF